MYKRAAIILTVVILIITLLVFFIIGKVNKNQENLDDPSVNNSEVVPIEDNEETQNTQNDEVSNTENTEEVENTNNTNNTNNTESDGNDSENVNNQQIVEVVKEVSSVKTIDESALSELESSDVDEVIVRIENKRLIMIDEDTDNYTGKMLSYCFDTTTPNGDKLTLFMMKSAYDSYHVGDKLNVVYQVYKNDVGSEFPVVLSVTSVSD